jgi:preprotein translocase subunit SecB
LITGLDALRPPCYAIPMSKTEEKIIDVEAPALPITIHAQYLKDLSFESPSSPAIFKGGLRPPKMDMNFNLDAKKVEDPENPQLYEVSIKLTITATSDNTVAFIVECLYGALASLQKDVPVELIRPMLFVEVPQMLFPFARQIVSSVTQNGGFPPLMLNPVDFRGMYLAQSGETKN